MPWLQLLQTKGKPSGLHTVLLGETNILLKAIQAFQFSPPVYAFETAFFVRCLSVSRVILEEFWQLLKHTGGHVYEQGM